VPFGDLDDPAEADHAEADLLPADDPEVAASLAVARATGTLLADPAEAWGNAAIPGFGIGQPVRAPELDPAANRPTLASPEEGARIARTFEIPPDRLVLATASDVPLLIASGSPGDVAGRNTNAFLVGLFGAVLAIGSAVALAVAIGTGIGS
jgi:hypothetical protein